MAIILDTLGKSVTAGSYLRADAELTLQGWAGCMPAQNLNPAYTPRCLCRPSMLQACDLHVSADLDSKVLLQGASKWGATTSAT